MCTQSVQLKVGLINKSPMGVHALYIYSTNVQNLKMMNLITMVKAAQYLYTAKHLV